MALNKTQLITVAAKRNIEIEDKETKDSLIEKIANDFNEKEDVEGLKGFLAENGLTLNDEGVIIKATKVKRLGENPNTKAYHTIKALEDESLAGLSYKELQAYLKETEGIETTSASISWYSNWMKQKGLAVVARKKVPKVIDVPAENEVPQADEVEETEE